mmetsp:Transcript_27168/g.43514  ORF Transcript_27168/g.43514 Transcript_27168/m.43514 type:complete len:198 (+) Transcript_27168:681-1274(+)
MLPAGIGGLSKLEELVLADNHLRVLPASLGSLTRLRRLDLSRNKFASAGPTSDPGVGDPGGGNGDGDEGDSAGLTHVGGCAALTELRLDGNGGLLGFPCGFRALASLQVLGGDHTGVRRIRGDFLQGCTALHTLSLRGCPVDVEELRATQGYEGFEARRQANRSKQIHGQVMIGSRGLDDGLDHGQHADRAIKGAHT